MKNNTSCSSNCPPAPENDKAKTKAVECRNHTCIPPSGTIYVPVVLSTVVLEADVEANIKLPTPAREIKEIRKNVSLNQCKAIPSLVANECKPGQQPKKHLKLFVSGVVHKNIQYVDENGYLKDYSVDVAFHCNQSVKVGMKPKYCPSSKAGSNYEFRYLDKMGHGGDRCQFGHYTDEIFNEPIECKLTSAMVHELDLLKHFDAFGNFNKITEKMEVVLCLKLLQDQPYNPTPANAVLPHHALELEHKEEEKQDGPMKNHGQDWKPFGMFKCN